MEIHRLIHEATYQFEPSWNRIGQWCVGNLVQLREIMSAEDAFV